ncbi:hypothetical protein C8R43DRAFT_561970 [Mycena crocata]|nr:hypothetical protein C8R43DRAFT_561970 [Mycena crocata]
MASFTPTPTIGALQVGVLVSYVLFGVTTTQTYIYYGRFLDDSRKLKCLVAFVWCCKLAHVVCIGLSIQEMTISDYGHPERLVRLPQSFVVAVVFSGTIAAVVQGFFALRIYRLSKRLYIPCLSWALSLARLMGSLLAFVYAIHMTTVMNFEAKARSTIAAMWTISAANDFLIAITLVYWLYQHRANAQTKILAIIDRLIAWTIETGVITSAVTIATLVLFLKMEETYIWLACFAVGARLFANSLLASLNSRACLRVEFLATRQVPESGYVMPQFNVPTDVRPELSRITNFTTPPNSTI